MRLRQKVEGNRRANKCERHVVCRWASAYYHSALERHIMKSRVIEEVATDRDACLKFREDRMKQSLIRQYALASSRASSQASDSASLARNHQSREANPKAGGGLPGQGRRSMRAK